MEERYSLIQAWKTQEGSLAELSRQFGVTRKTAYKWVNRYQSEGVEALRDRSRAPHRQANAIPEAIERRIVEARQHWPRWGPRKLRLKLASLEPQIDWPSRSCIAALLKRKGLVVARRRRPHHRRVHSGLTSPANTNQVWTADFKGWFLTRDRQRCQPLTIMDLYSRFLIRCHIVPHSDVAHTQAVFDAAFRECGLPEVIRSDNGTPFATVGRCGLTRLSVRWIKLGIRPERTRPGRPQQNGAHERMHRTLNAETAQPPAAHARAQQRRFDEFRQLYNGERPHDALGGATPASLYQRSSREFIDRLPAPAYDASSQVRTVMHGGEIKYRSKTLFLSEALRGERVGLKQISDEQWRVSFSFYELGIWDYVRDQFWTPAEWLLRAARPARR